jgi:hypothetical protein
VKSKDRVSVFPKVDDKQNHNNSIPEGTKEMTEQSQKVDNPKGYMIIRDKVPAFPKVLVYSQINTPDRVPEGRWINREQGANVPEGLELW